MKAHEIVNNEELIKALRNHRTCDTSDCETCELMNDAADALEKLIKERDKYEELWRDEVQT